MYRDASVRNDTIPESEIDLSGEPQTPYDQETDEHDVISNTRKRRRLLHKSLASARFSLDDFDENDVIPAQADCSVPAFVEKRSDLFLERFALLVLKVTHFLLSQKRIVNLARLSLRDTSTPSSSSRREVTAPSNQTVRFGRPDLPEVCANSDSPLVEAVENAGGEGLRISFWNGI